MTFEVERTCTVCGGYEVEHPYAGLVRFEWATTARPEGWLYYRPAEGLEGPSLLLRDHSFTVPGDGSFPRNAMCTCGCRGSQHETIWKDGEFKGTRCARHAGHKFEPAEAP